MGLVCIKIMSRIMGPPSIWTKFLGIYLETHSPVYGQVCFATNRWYSLAAIFRW